MSERGYEASDLADNRRPVVAGALLICAVVTAGFAAAWIAQTIFLKFGGGALGDETFQGAGDAVRVQRLAVEAEWAAEAEAWSWRSPEVAKIPVERAAALSLAHDFFKVRPGTSRLIPARGAR